MRVKACPFKSLTDVDYNHPSVVFWFFGQNPNKQQLQYNGNLPTIIPVTASISSSNLASTSPTATTMNQTVKNSLHGYPSSGHSASGISSSNSTEDRIITRKGEKRKAANNTNSNKNDIKKEKLDLTHPLANEWMLTDIQELVTEIILTEGGSCHFDTIVDQVSKKWKGNKRRESNADIKKIIKDTLQPTTEIPIFKSDKSKPDGYWSVCQTFAEANQQSRVKGDLHDDGSEEKRSTSKDGYHTEEATDLLDDDDDDKQDRKLTELQTMICECINDNGGSCHYDMIVHHVSKVKGGSSISDPKGAILSALTDSKRLFKRDTKRTGWWMINNDKQLLIPKKEDNSSLRGAHFRKSRRGVQSPESSAKEVTSVPSAAEHPEHSEGEDSGNNGQKKNDPPMTSLQILIFEAVDMAGGSATFDQIYDHVSQHFDTLKRRDGTPYTSDCRRAIQASLSNNPATRPFFKKDTKKGITVWELAKRSRDFLADYKKKRETGSKLNDVKEELPDEEEESHHHQGEEGERPTTPSASVEEEEYEEEIKDEEDEEEEEEEERGEEQEESDDHAEDSEKMKEDKESAAAVGNNAVRSEKSFYANRLKRAKQLQAKRPSHNKSPDSPKSDKEKETRTRKRRK